MQNTVARERMTIASSARGTFRLFGKAYELREAEMMLRKALPQKHCSICQEMMAITDDLDENFGGSEIVSIEIVNGKLLYASGEMVPEDGEDWRRVERFIKSALIGAHLCPDCYFDLSPLLKERA